MIYIDPIARYGMCLYHPFSAEPQLDIRKEVLWEQYWDDH